VNLAILSFELGPFPYGAWADAADLWFIHVARTTDALRHAILHAMTRIARHAILAAILYAVRAPAVVGATGHLDF
jgi:hypothetical protein